MTYVVKATFEKVKTKGEWYETRNLFVAYSDGTWETIVITGFNKKIMAPCYYASDERLPEWKREVSRFHKLEQYIQPWNMVRGKMEKSEVHKYISAREQNWNNF